MAKSKSQTKNEESTQTQEYPSPKPYDREFTRHWNEYLETIKNRENFKPIHLRQLEVLCDCHSEYQILTDYIRENGYTFVTGGSRHGEQIKIRPEVGQLNICKNHIRSYCHLLGIGMKIDNGKMKAPKEDENEWV